MTGCIISYLSCIWYLRTLNLKLMKQKMYSVFLAMLAVLCSQKVSATSFLNVNQNQINESKANDEKGVLLQESFSTGMGEFYVEGEKGYSNDIWTFRDDHMEATSYFKYTSTTGEMYSYFVSPEFTLGESDNFAYFDHDGMYFYPDMQRCALVIREVGEENWDKLKDMKYPADCNAGAGFVNTGEMAVPSKYNGKRVQIAFRLHAESSYSDGIWMFKNLVVKTYGQMPVLKNEAGISFEVKEITYTLESGEFAEPALINPNNLNITYSSSNEDVATIDAETGKITILGPGNTEISAKSEETEDFYSGIARYTLNVLKPFAGFYFDKSEVSYEIGSGEIFNAPELVNPNGMSVTYGSSDLNVANVDYTTGAVQIMGMGTAVIKATSYETEKYAYTEASYTINVTDPSVIYMAMFADGFDGFTEEGKSSDIGIWTWKYGWVIASGNYLVTEMTEAYLVSPEFTLDEGANSVSFNMQGYNFASWADEAQILIRENGGEWVNIPIKTYPDQGSYTTYNSGDLVIPEQFNGKKVQLGFRYVTDGYQKAGYWYINHLIVKKSIKKEEAGISYDVAEVNAEIGKKFTEPVLNNPNNLNVLYSSNNPAVASVNEKTGKVTINSVGIATITAKSLENKEFYEGVAEYTINVTDPSMVFFEDFAGGKGKFNEEGTSGIWEWSWGGYMKADGFYKVTELTESYLVSPEIKLDDNGNKVSFEEMASVFNGKVEEYAQLVIREAGSSQWEKIEGLNRPINDTYEPSKTGDAVIPEKYNGKNVQLAFKYVTDGYSISGMWYVTKLMVKRAVAEKADPEIAFDKTNVEYVIGSDAAFVAPELINPNNVPVRYSSSDANVAVVDELTGEVTFIGKGEVKITATSEETDVFKSGEASYTITVSSVPTGIEGVSAEELSKARIYDLQGRRIYNPGKGVYIVNGKKVIIK